MNKVIQNSIVVIASLLAVLVPLLLSIFYGAQEPYWLDSPEFTAAVQMLGIPHPPGHPLYVMFTKPFTLLPLGSIPMRVSIASAVYGAVAAHFLFKSTFIVLQKVQDATPEWFNAVVALATVLLATLSYGWWFQSVRQEVYSFQMMMVMGALYPVIQYVLPQAENKVGDYKSNEWLLYISAFILGLGLTNHHFIMLTVLPAAVPAIVVMFARIGDKRAIPKLLNMTALVFYGLLPYLFLPLRSFAGTPIAFGGVHSLSDFFWVVSAKVYQKSMTRESSMYLKDEPLDALFSIMSQLGPIIVIVALAGIYLLIRRRSTRLIGVTIALAGGVALLLRSMMGFDPYNSDYYGYVLISIAMIALCAGVFVSVAVHVMYKTFKYSKFVSPVIAILILLLPVSIAINAAPKVDLSNFCATRKIQDMAILDAPENTVVIASYYKLFFLLWSAKYIEGTRPDITVVNPQLFGYPGYLAHVTKANPELKKLAWSIFTKGIITERAITEIAFNRTLKMAPSPWMDARATSYLVPDGLLYKAKLEPATTAEINAKAKSHMEAWNRFYTFVGDDVNELETWRFLSWSHYLDAIFFAQKGSIENAKISIEFSRKIGSSTEQINGLEDALKESDGPIDITPFLLTTSQE